MRFSANMGHLNNASGLANNLRKREITAKVLARPSSFHIAINAALLFLPQVDINHIMLLGYFERFRLRIG